MSRPHAVAGGKPLGSPDQNLVLPSAKPWNASREIGALVDGFTASAWARPRLESLARETNPELFWQDLHRLGRDAELRQNTLLATKIYAHLSDPKHPNAYAKRAELTLGALTGESPSTADQLERLSSVWIGQATDPAMLLGMTGAGVAYRGARAFSLKALSRWGVGEGFGTWGLRSFSGLGGFFAEVPAFVLTTKGVNQGLGRKVSWDTPSLWEEMQSAALILGALKLSSFLGNQALSRLHQFDPIAGPARFKGIYGFSSRALPNGSMLGGIMVGHSADAFRAGRVQPDLSTNLLESAATLLQFQAAGRLMPALAPGYQRHTQSWDRHFESLLRESTTTRIPQRPFWPGISESNLAWAGPTVSSRPNPELFSPQNYMVAKGSRSSGKPQGDALDRAWRASNAVKLSQAGELPYPEALKQVKAVLGEWIQARPKPDFGEADLNLLTKILVGKSLTPRALAQRFGGDGLATSARPYIFGDKLGFNIRIETGRELLAQFDVDLLFKEVFLLGRWQRGWVAHRGRMYLNNDYKWRGYWTLLTLQLAEWARTGNFIAIESESSSDGGKASLADIFDVARPEQFYEMRRAFQNNVDYEGIHLDPATAESLDSLQHPWELMEIRDVNKKRVGYRFLKNYSEHWRGILPVQGLDSLQWRRLLRRAFIEKKLWNLDSRFPVPANTRVGKLDSDTDLLHYSIDHSVQRYLSSLQRMEDHLIEYQAPSESTFGPLWRSYYSQRIRPMEDMIREFRHSLRQIPRELDAGEVTIPEALDLLNEAQANLLEFKVTLRNLTANLYLDYLIQHRLAILEKMYEESLELWEAKALTDFRGQIEVLHERLKVFQGKPSSLMQKMGFLRELEPRVQDISHRQAEVLAGKLLSERWGTDAVPKVFRDRLTDFIAEAFWRQINGEPELLTSFTDMALTLATIYSGDPWDFAASDSVSSHDLLWGLGNLKAYHAQTFQQAKPTTEILDQSVKNIRGLRSLFPEHLSLLLVKGSHFKAPLLTPLGQDSNLTLVVAPSRGSFEGGLAFALYPNAQVPFLQRGKTRPIFQVVLRLNPQNRSAEILVPQNGRHTHVPKNAQIPAYAYHALKYVAVRWANSHGYQTPAESYVMEMEQVKEWTPLINALNRLSFSPSEKLSDLFQDKSAQEAFQALEAQNPFRIPTETRQDLH